MRRVEQAINKWHVMFRFFFMKWPTQIWAKLWKLKTEKSISFPGRALPVALRWWQQAADDPLACRVNLCARNYWTSVICSSLGFTNKEILRRSSFNRWFIWFIALPEAIVWICKHNKINNTIKCTKKKKKNNTYTYKVNVHATRHVEVKRTNEK